MKRQTEAGAQAAVPAVLMLAALLGAIGRKILTQMRALRKTAEETGERPLNATYTWSH